ncbi:hypothetical protein FFF34_015530 [Inquilinus sp. KBS0705]|nr:hypothetical protein FFF34_015530 [Inquilinus sp. KBS0705]
MKKISLIILFVFAVSFNIAKNRSIKNPKSDTTINKLFFYKKSGNDSLKVSIVQLDELSKVLKKDTNTFRDITPSLVALIVVVISTLGAIYIGKKQIKVQTSNAAQQLKSQEAQAQELLKLSREQIRETSKMTLTQVRANNVSQARIAWIQDLRELLSKFNGEVALVNTYVEELISLIEKGNDEKVDIIYKDVLERLKTARIFSFQIKLFLNKQEEDHMNLENALDKYFRHSVSNPKDKPELLNSLSDEILNLSRAILKKAWEQAKNEGSTS